MTLQEGEYFIPDGYTVKQVGRTIKVYKSKKHTLEEGDYRCMHCVHYVKGYSKLSSRFETEVCNERPFGEKNGVFRYYSAQKYGKPCEKFEARGK